MLQDNPFARIACGYRADLKILREHATVLDVGVNPALAMFQFFGQCPQFEDRLHTQFGLYLRQRAFSCVFDQNLRGFTLPTNGHLNLASLQYRQDLRV